MKDAEVGTPYPGAKEAYILDLSDRQLVLRVVAELWDVLPFPKRKAKV